MKPVLAFTAVAEAATGLGLLVAPALIGQLLLGAELAGPAATVARVAGVALIALGIACWPGTPQLGMTFYSAAMALYLGWAGLTGLASGILLWPAVALHFVLTALLARGAVGARVGRT